MAMTQFRRSAMSNSQSKGKGGGGGGWYDKYKLPNGPNPAPFVLINAEYLDPNPSQERIVLGPDGKPLPVKNLFFKHKEHTKKSFRGGKEYFPKEECSQGWNPHNPRPCAGCMAMDMGEKLVTLSERFAFGIVHLSQYHRHPLVDYKTGQVRMKQDNSGLFFTHSECDGRTCNFCRVKTGQPPVLKQGESFPYNPADITTEFGHRRYLDIGKNHLANLQGWDATISSQCCAHIYNPQGQLLARCSNQLTRNSFNCPNCNNVVIDMSADPRSDEEIDAAVANPYLCLTCQKAVLLKEIVSCDQCAGAQRPFVQLGIADVVLWGKRQGEGTQSQMLLQQFQTLEEFQRSLPPHIQQLLGGKSVADIVKELGTPFDFDKVLEPKSLDEQVKRLELQNLHTPGVQQTSAYAQPPTGAMGMPPQMQPAAPFQPQVQPYAPYQPSQTGQPTMAPATQAPVPYVPYQPSTTTGPGPQPFMAPAKPNFGK